MRDFTHEAPNIRSEIYFQIHNKCKLKNEQENSTNRQSPDPPFEYHNFLGHENSTLGGNIIQTIQLLKKKQKIATYYLIIN